MHDKKKKKKHFLKLEGEGGERNVVFEGRGTWERGLLCYTWSDLACELIYIYIDGLLNRGSSIQKAMHKGRRKDFSSSWSNSGDGSASSSGFEDIKSIDGRKGTDKGEKMASYRFQLEKEVKLLQKQLQEEIDLHIALANAVEHDNEPLIYPSKIPHEAQKLLANIAELEITVSKLEEELVALHFWLNYERNQCHLAETHQKYLPSLPLKPPTSISGFMWEEHIHSLRASKFGGSRIPSSPRQYLSSESGLVHPATANRLSELCMREEFSGLCSASKQKKEVVASIQQTDEMDQGKNLPVKNLWNNPTRLSGEMLRCMRNIFLSLSKSQSASSKMSSSKILPSSSLVGHLSGPSVTSLSDSSMIPQSIHSSLSESPYSFQELISENSLDPYRVNRKVNWKNAGSYGLADEVSWMSVGREQLEYAAEALKKFRFLVEELVKVNPARMSNEEKLAFWINLYNTLIMHAYLAYGVPKSDIKLFALMQKVSYTVGGQSFSAADIEFVLLKMKPPAHRPQIALVLAIHNFKISEEHRTYSINNPEPLLVFVLSSGMYSSPAVRIFTANNVHDELQKSMRDYIQASVGMSDKGKLLVPKLLHGFARGIVEDSLLVDWICRYLTPDQVTIVRDSTSQQKQRLLGVRSFSIIPFDSRFRYLLLPDNRT